MEHSVDQKFVGYYYDYFLIELFHSTVEKQKELMEDHIQIELYFVYH